MPVLVNWFIKDEVIRLQSIGDLTYTDFEEGTRCIFEYLNNSTSHRVHILFDETQLTSIPRDIAKMRELASWITHPKVGWAIAYGNEDRFLRFATTFVTHIVRLPYRRFDTYEQAYQFLLKKTPTLPDIFATQAML